MEDYENRTPEQWVAYYQGGYLSTMTLDTATRIIKSDMTNMARTCVSIGFHLKAVRDRELFREAGYENLWEYAADQFGLSLSSASRYISINDQFSVGGNTPQLQEAYRNFSKSQLQEMITMSDEQKALVTEDMTVRDIRKIKNPKNTDLESAAEEGPEEQIPGQMEIADYPEALPDESVATSQKTGKCLHQPEFLCALSETDKNNPGNGEDCGYHCCWSCTQHGDCKLECISSAGRPVMKHKVKQEAVGEQTERSQEKADSPVNNPAQVIDGEFREVEEPEKEELFEESTDESDLELARKELEKANDFLKAMLKCYTENDWRVRKQKLIVAALAGFICDLDLIENPPEKPEQPELPVMKNNEQRKEWLRNYKDWGLWYEDEHIGCRYYRYVFENGATLIAEEYDCANPYAGEYTTSYLHLVGGPEPPKHTSYGIRKWQRNERYNRYPNNETELVEFLKAIQKGGK